MVGYLAESALLTHGLRSISEEELIRMWPQDSASIAWMEDGRLRVGGIEDSADSGKRRRTLTG